MASQLVLSTSTAYLTHIGAGNSFFTGTTEVNQGNIRAAVGASSPSEIYNDTAALQWSGPISPSAIPLNTETGQFAVIDTFTAVSDLSADYTCRRNATTITTGGRIQQAISSNNGLPMENDARFCLYYPSEDFNQEVLVHDYTTTDAGDLNQGNNIAELLANITGRMKNFVGNNGPVCNGTLNNDLLDDNTSIFRKGCILTWETAATAGDALIVAPGA
jgi:hypothetical protein